MWHGGPTRAWPLLVVIIDEAHTYFRDYKGSDPQTRNSPRWPPRTLGSWKTW